MVRSYSLSGRTLKGTPNKQDPHMQKSVKTSRGFKKTTTVGNTNSSGKLVSKETGSKNPLKKAFKDVKEEMEIEANPTRCNGERGETTWQKHLQRRLQRANITVSSPLS